jgi:hypothetical protein
MVRPYLERPLRSYEDALRDRVDRLAAQQPPPFHDAWVDSGSHAIATAGMALIGADPPDAALSVSDMLNDAAAVALLTADTDLPPVLPLDVAAPLFGTPPLLDRDLIDLGLPTGTFG